MLYVPYELTEIKKSTWFILCGADAPAILHAISTFE